MSVCVNVFVFVKDFSGITKPRILKFATNIGYDLLHYGKEKQPPSVYSSLY